MTGKKSRPKSRNLKVRCATWDQVEAFYEKKIKEDRTLTIRVPFNPKKGDTITLSLGMPNDMVMSLDGAVVIAKPDPDGKRAQVMLKLHGMTDSVIGKLRAFVKDGRGGSDSQRLDAAPTQPPAPVPDVATPPPAEPTDAPVDEVVDQRAIPTVGEVHQEQRDVFLALEAEHRKLREAAAHDVLGVPWDADVAAIRQGYFALVKKHHPDVYSRHRSQAVMHLSEEVFIHINKAYDRMREAAAAAGNAIIAGPALLPHNGWVAGFEDVADAGPEQVVITTVRGSDFVDPAPKAPLQISESGPVTVNFGGGDTKPEADPTPAAPLTADGLFGDLDDPSEKMPARPASESSQVSQLFATRSANESEKGRIASLEMAARDALDKDDYSAATELLADALHLDARNRPLRALYHVARGHQLADRGEAVDATTQYETALRHDPDCARAHEALQTRRASKKKGLFGRFKK